jgi:hypothetical protein
MNQLIIESYTQKQLGKIPPPHFTRIIKQLMNWQQTQDHQAVKN